MKNLKKVLALVLAFACAFTMFAGALTFSDVKPGDDYSAAITMLSDLEVISGDGKGNYNPTGTITRAEACVLIANMMNGGKADTARFAGGSNFSDVPKTYWGESAIAYCVQNGVTYGVGGGKFAPTRQITDAEFVAMVTRAMGYDTAANPLSFPYGNYTAAVNNGIVDNVPYVEGSPCTRGEAAQIIYDCLFADYARYTANQNVIHNSDDHMASTLIEVVFGLDRAANADDDKCTQHYWVILGESCEDEDVIFAAPITDKKGEADYSDKAIVEFDCEADVSALIGRKVVLWGENTHANSTKSWEVDTVKAVETVDGQKSYDYNPTMDWEDDLDLDEVKTAYLKGVASSKIEDYIETKNGNSYVLFDWDDDKEIDFISVTERYYATVDTLTSKKVIIDLNTDDDKEVYTLDLADGEYTFDCTELPEGYCCDKAVKHDYEVVLDKNVEEDDVVEITVEDTYDQTLVITINKVDSETKELTKIDSKGKVYFDDEKMEQAEKRFVNDDVNGLKKADVDTDYDVWTNANGYIIKIDEASESNNGYFLVLGVEDGEKKSIASRSTKASMEVMYTDGTTAELDVAFDADGGAMKKYYNDDDYTFIPVDGTNANGEWIVGGVFEYKLNDDGEIEKIVEVEDEISTEYEYDEKYTELEYTSVKEQGKKNTVKFTGKDFVFVVDKDYVEKTSQTKKTQDTLSVDKDLVVCLTIDELEDIDKADTAVASEGRYDNMAGAIAGLDDQDQNGKSYDYADGALLVVDDIDDYTGTKSHVVGAVTDVSVNSKGVYTFEMNEDESYSTGKTDKDKTLFEDGFKISKADDAIIESIASGKDNVKTYGYALYADLTIRNDEVVAVALLVERDGTDMVPKTDDDFKGAKVDSDYRVIRGIIDRVVSDEVRIIPGAIAASDETIFTIDEYMDVTKASFELNDDTVVFATNEIPGLVAEKALNGHIAYDKDFEITKDGKLEESIFNSKTGTDTYYVVDLIVDVDDDDEPVVAAYTFDDVEDEKPAATSETSIEAACYEHPTKIAVEIFRTVKEFGKDAVTAAIPEAELKAIKDAKFHVTIKRPIQNPDTVGDPYQDEPITLTIVNVSYENGKAIINLSAETPVEALDKVTVTVDGYGVDTYVDPCVM